MKRVPVIALPLCMLAGWTSCQKGQGEPGKGPKAGQELPALLLGRYMESANDSSDATEHTVKAREWTQLDPGAPNPVKVQVLQHLGLSSGIWAVVLDYTHPSSKESRMIRADLWRESDSTLWLCRHPEIRTQDPLQVAPGDRADLLGQGCFGAPWRKLERVP